MSTLHPDKTFVVVADGAGAKFFRIPAHPEKMTLIAEGFLHPSNLESEGPSGKGQPDRSRHENDEATFAKQLAHELYRRAHNNEFTALRPRCCASVQIEEPWQINSIRRRVKHYAL